MHLKHEAANKNEAPEEIKNMMGWCETYCADPGLHVYGLCYLLILSSFTAGSPCLPGPSLAFSLLSGHYLNLAACHLTI